MQLLREYILSVAAAGILCGILKSILGEKGTSGAAAKLICGLFLAFTVIRPLTDIRLSDFAVFTSAIESDARKTAEIGEQMAVESMSDIIKVQTEAYILDKAASLGVDIQVEVTLGGDTLPVPVALRIHGDYSPYAKAQLEEIFTKELGIAKENQLWIG